MSLSVKDFLTLADVKARIVRLGANAADVQKEIHLIACSTLDHVRAHGDSTGAVALMNALPVGQRVKALSFWFRTFSNGKINMKLADKVWSCTLGKNRTEADFDIQGAIAVTFADLTAERDPTTLEVEKFIKSLERTANNSDNFDGTDLPKVSVAARALAAKLVKYIRAGTPAVQDTADAILAAAPVAEAA